MKGHLLIVDDDNTYRRSLRSLLEIEGYEVDEANSIVEFHKKINIQQTDLVLTDLRLGNPKDPNDFSGFEIAKILVKMKIPCIFITAYPSQEAVVLALRSRGSEPLAEDFFIKNTSSRGVIDTINNVLIRYKETQNGHELE